MKKLRHILEVIPVYIFFAILRILPLDAASAVGGWIGRYLARLHKTTKIARKNLKRAMPELSADEIEIIIGDMWENMGRTIAEYPHLPSDKMTKRIKIVKGREIFDEVIASDKPAIFVAGHIGNWEVAPKIGNACGTPLTLIYRHANNPYADAIIRKTRLQYARAMHPKGPVGAKELIKSLKNNEVVGLLTDQKMNDGISVPFFGRDAMTAPATAQLSLKYDAPIYMARVIRDKGAHFRFSIEPLEFKKSGDNKKDIYNIMLAINSQFESWIREYPAQWFWMHNRWPKEHIVV